MKARPERGWAVKMEGPYGAWLWRQLWASRTGAWSHAIESWSFALKQAHVPENRRAQQRWLARHRGVSIVRAYLDEAAADDIGGH